VDFELTEAMPVAEFQQKLTAQLPDGIPVYRVEVVDVNAPAATQVLEKAEYVITVGIVETETPESPPTLQEWQQWVEQVLASQELCTEHTTKSGKTQTINLRDRLFTLQLETTTPSPHPPIPLSLPLSLRYIGSCRNDGTLLRPEQVVYMLEQVAQRELQLLRVHRDRLILAIQ
jgi:radical SAM-linked protein